MAKIIFPYYIFLSSISAHGINFKTDASLNTSIKINYCFEKNIKLNLIEHSHSTPIKKKTSNTKTLSKKMVSKKNTKKHYKIYFTSDSLKVVEGLASFYNDKFHGRKTASGEIFDQNILTAASNIFPINTPVKVINLQNNDTIHVIINDRMHPRMLNKGRVIDLSKKGAQLLNFIHQGLLKVKIISVQTKLKNKR